MSNPNLDEYRQPWDSDEHWALRKEFIEKYYDQFSEDRLLCLAQVYANVELLGCSYPAPVMQQIRGLSHSLTGCKEIQQSRKSRAAVQFVEQEQKANNKRAFEKPHSQEQELTSAKIFKSSQLISIKQIESTVGNSFVNQDQFNRPHFSLSPGNSQDSIPSTSTKYFNSQDSIPSTSTKYFNSQVSIPSTSTKYFNSQDSVPRTGNYRLQETNSVEINCSSDPCLSQHLSESSETIKESHSFITDHKMNKNSNSSEVPKLDVLFIFHEMGKLIRAQIVKQRQPTEAIHNAAQKLKEKVEFEIHLAPDGLKHTPTYISTLKIHDILISEAKASSKKNARSEAAKYGVEKLMKSSLEVVLINNVLTLKETALQKKEKLPQENKKVQPKPCLQSSSRNQQAKQFTKPNAPVSGSSKSQQILQDFKFNGATFPQHFLLLDNSDARRMEGPIALLTNSASFCHVPLQFEFENLPHVPGHHLSIRCDIVFGKRVLSSAANISKQAAKIDAVEAALVKLRKLVYTVKVKDEHSDGFFISRNQVLDITGSENSLSENNIGCKMLKMMGWSGGGIGKQGNVGIAEPVAAEDAHEHGKGLGYSSDRAISKRFTSRIESLIQDYAKSNTTSDLIFATEFSKEERKEIHRIATKYGLKNNSVGKEENRHIIVRRRFTAQELLAHLLEVGGSTNKYELIPPESDS